MEKKYLAFDLGASGGRLIGGIFDGEKITLQELYRFENTPVKLGDTLCWDFPTLMREIKHGLVLSKAFGVSQSLGVDTWGVDFGLLSKSGELTANPVHYRDKRTAGMLEYAFTLLNKKRFYEITGIQFMELNTAFQLLSIKKNDPSSFENAETLLLMPDLIEYFLTGVKSTEYSIASTTQMLDAESGAWSDEVLLSLGIDKRLLTAIIPSGTVKGELSENIVKETEVNKMRVTAVCGHDTQCAMAAVPTEEDDFIFLSCGTWSLLGTETDKPITTEKAFLSNLTNEGGYGGKTSFLKNITGLWLLQEMRRFLKANGNDISFAEMEKQAREAEPFKCFIDTDSEEFVTGGDIPEKVKAYCRRTGQCVPEKTGEVLRAIYESLAMKYKYCVKQIEFCTGKSYRSINLVGGGVKDAFLCSLTASACGKTVFAGPVEATAFGNIAIQILSAGEIGTLKQARKIIASSSEIKTYRPEKEREFSFFYQKYKEATGLC